jgi:cytochrome c553
MASLALQSAASKAEKLGYNRDIRPLLAENCFRCHGPDSAARKAGLRLDQRAAAMKAAVLAPGRPGDSELVRRIFSDDADDMMPPPAVHKTLTTEQKDRMRQWIAEGAEYQPHWSFIAPSRPQPPAAPDPAWVRTPIDNFVLAKLREHGLAPAAEADRRTLARRVSLDLRGLPPTPAEVEALANDPAPDAYEKFVDRLLQSPQWGEHRAHYWLDAARYADTHGLHFDNYREIWAYRDWVISAFNRNMSFDQFSVEQLAGDLLPNPSLEQRIATGLNRSNTTTNEGGAIDEEYLVLYARDRTETTARIWLGLTANCAVCHDHKFDPLSQKEFYSLSAFFNNTTQAAMDGNIKDTPPTIFVPRPEDRERGPKIQAELADANRLLEERRQTGRGDLDKWLAGTKPEVEQLASASRIAALLAKAADRRTDAEKNELYAWWLLAVDKRYQELTARVATLAQQQAALRARGTVAYVMQERAGPPTAYVLFRGEYDKRREQVSPGTPAFLPPMPPELPRNRLGLGRWLLRPEQPLTARVAVNRFWQELFGTGIVRTAEDFGVTGEAPSHGELLDWLAVEFRDSGWDVKRLFRLLVTSAAYRQAATATAEKLEKDPQNRLLSRGPRFRMDAEMVRDYALAAGGLLAAKIGGPSVRPYQPDGVWEAVAMPESNTRYYQRDNGENCYRRSLYTFWKRAAPPASMDILNAPTREVCTVRRERTNTPLQALVCLNDPQFVEAARHLAQATLSDGGATLESRLDYAARRLLARPLRPDESQALAATVGALLKYYQSRAEEAKQLLTVGQSKADPLVDAPSLAAWTMFANTMMNLDEVLNK